MSEDKTNVNTWTDTAKEDEIMESDSEEETEQGISEDDDDVEYLGEVRRVGNIRYADSRNSAMEPSVLLLGERKVCEDVLMAEEKVIDNAVARFEKQSQVVQDRELNERNFMDQSPSTSRGVPTYSSFPAREELFRKVTRPREPSGEDADLGHLIITNFDAKGAPSRSTVFQSRTIMSSSDFPKEIPILLYDPPAQPWDDPYELEANVNEQKSGLALLDYYSKLPSGKQGIEWCSNSCYLDATLFAMFSASTVFDPWLFTLNFSQDPGDFTAVKTAYALKAIATQLRETGVCPASLTTRLRDAISKVNPKFKESMMDVDDFLQNLFGRALKLSHFISYNVGSKNFVHQIVTDPTEPVQFELKDMLCKSMFYQNLKFAEIPAPALILKMPISDGVPMFKSVLPNLTIDIAELMENPIDMEKTMFHLLAVIALNNKHYTAYVRQMNRVKSYEAEKWVFFNSLQGQVIPQQSFSSSLRDAEMKVSGVLGAPLDETRKVLDMMQDCFACIYYSSKTNP